MHYVILRDDDTNALTPVECLEQLYRPFLDRSLPVNLAVIPNVRTDTLSTDGVLEKYLLAKRATRHWSFPSPATPDSSDTCTRTRDFMCCNTATIIRCSSSVRINAVILQIALRKARRRWPQRDFMRPKHLSHRMTGSPASV